MMKNIDISVIIPVYNTGKEAIRILDVLKKESLLKVEIILVNDGSSDDSSAILSEYCKNSRNIFLFDEQNHGASAARNLGIKNAHGRYLAFIDSDDMISADYLDELHAAYLNANCVLACTGMKYHRVKNDTTEDVCANLIEAKQDKETKKTYILRLLNNDGRLYGVINKLFIRKIIVDNNIEFDTELDFAEDTKFVLEYLKYAYIEAADEKEIISIPEPLYFYNYGTATSTVAKSSLKWKNWKKSLKYLSQWLGDKPTKDELVAYKVIRRHWKLSYMMSVLRNQL